MTKEQYESLPLAQLKAIAKTRGMKEHGTGGKSGQEGQILGL